MLAPLSWFFRRARKRQLGVETLFYSSRRRSPVQAFYHMLDRWEGEWQDHPQDTANWVEGRLLGTKWGVTPRTLAAHRGIPLDTITKEMMQDVGLEEAALVVAGRYFADPGFDELPWSPPVEALVDFGYNAGPRMATRALQELVAVAPDGVVGPITVRGFTDWLLDHGPIVCLDRFRKRRIQYYERVVKARPSNKVFLKGWKNRANHYTADNEEWWNLWT